MSLLPGMSADEFTLYGGSTDLAQIGYYQDDLNETNIADQNFWDFIYPDIYIANAAIEGLTNNKALTPQVDQQLLGEAKFMRAFYYFYLVNLYGDVPLVTGTDYKANLLLPRAAQAAVYQQIVADLKDAQSLLSDQYLDATLLTPTPARVRPTKWAATAMLARTYLYLKDWPDAEAEASLIISNNSTYSLSPLNSVFLENSSEAIWQLQPVIFGENTVEGSTFILPPSGPNYANTVYLSPSLLNSFEPGDQRYKNWVSSVTDTLGNVPVTYYFPFKYKINAINVPVTEYSMVLRLAEQYLIRAEARAEQGNIPGASADLNVIRSRAGLPNTTAASESALLTAVLHERQVELFSEWGHRWLDLKRTGQVDAVMTIVAPEKGGAWKTTKQLYPLPLNDLLHDPSLIQNPGY